MGGSDARARTSPALCPELGPSWARGSERRDDARNGRQETTPEPFSAGAVTPTRAQGVSNHPRVVSGEVERSHQERIGPVNLSDPEPEPVVSQGTQYRGALAGSLSAG